MGIEDIVWEQVGALAADESDEIRAMYPEKKLFRSNIIMERHGFGRGEYRYFSYPLPDVITHLRTSLYPHLVPIANRWNEAMRIDIRYPVVLAIGKER